MTHRNRCIALTLVLLPAACGQSAAPRNSTEPPFEAAPSRVDSGANSVNARIEQDATNVVGPSPDLSPPLLTPEAERGEKGARNVLLSLARAIELKQFDQAWALLSPADKAKWSRTAFAQMFADLGKITVAVPSGTIEGAAGSSYYTAPVAITANDKDGRPVRIEGEAVLRRVNDVPGATAAQLRWHFETLKLDWTH